MPYKNAATIPVRRSTKSKLEEFKGDGEAWDAMLDRIAETALDGGERQ